MNYTAGREVAGQGRRRREDRLFFWMGECDRQAQKQKYFLTHTPTEILKNAVCHVW